MQKDTNPSAVISPYLCEHLIGMAAKEKAVTATTTPFPLETACLASLSAASHAVGSVYTVCYPDGEPLPVPLYAIAEQPSGTGKSKIMNDFYRGYLETGAKINKDIIVERESLKKEILSEQKQGNNVHANKLALLESMVEIPRLTTDATPQSIEKVMDRYKGYFLVAGTEQNLTKTLLGGLYSEGQRVDGIINSAFNGEFSGTERASVDRVTFQGRPFGGIFCLSQEGTIQTVLDSAGSSGLAERFLMIREDDLLGERDRFKDLSDKDLMDIVTGSKKPPKQMIKAVKEQPPTPAYDQYKRRMSELAVERKDLQGYELHDLKRLHFKPEAWAMVEAAKSIFERSIAKQRIRNSFIASMSSKIDILVMKVSATIHAMDNEQYQELGDIDCKAVASAFATVSALFHGVTKISKENKLYGDDVEDEFVLEYIQSQRNPVSLEKILQNVPRKKDHPFKFYQKRGEAREKIKLSLTRLLGDGRVCERKGANPVYSA